jgi:hypothetical protein
VYKMKRKQRHKVARNIAQLLFLTGWCYCFPKSQDRIKSVTDDCR